MIFGGNLGWSDQVERIKQKMKHTHDQPDESARNCQACYTDQDGNDVPLCVICCHWRATNGDMCEACARTLARALDELP